MSMTKMSSHPVGDDRGLTQFFRDHVPWTPGVRPFRLPGLRVKALLIAFSLKERLGVDHARALVPQAAGRDAATQGAAKACAAFDAAAFGAAAVAANAAMVGQTAAAAHSLREQAHPLAEEVSRFRLPAAA